MIFRILSNGVALVGALAAALLIQGGMSAALPLADISSMPSPAPHVAVAAPGPEVEWAPSEAEAPEACPPEPAPEAIVKRQRRARARLPATAAVQAPAAALPDPGEALRFALRRERDGLERCYDAELKRRAPFRGSILMAVSVSAAGRVEDVRVVETSARSGAVAACIGGRLRTLRLPELDGDAELLVPFHLEVRDALP